MGFKDLFFRQKDKESVDEPISSTENQAFPQSTNEPVSRMRREIDIPDYAVEQWSTAFFNEDISIALDEINWKDPTVEELTLLLRNTTNCIKDRNQEFVKINFIKYMMSNILNRYYKNNFLFNLSEDKKDIVIKEFMMVLVQALNDVCTIFGIDFYNLFISIKNVPVYNERKGDTVVEHYFKYSFRYFTKLWENSKSKFLLDKREKHIMAYEDIMCSFFEEFLENAEPVDIDAIYKFSIQNEELIEVDFAEMISDAIEDGYYEPKVYIGKGAELAIARCYPELLVNAYINRFNSILLSMRPAIEEYNLEKIDFINEEMIQIIKTISDYQDYRSEEFKYFFADNWEWYMGGIVDEFSGKAISVFYDFLVNIVKIPKEIVEDEIISDVLFLFIDYDTGEKYPLNNYLFAEAVRLFTNEIAFETIYMINPYLVYAFS